MPSLQDSMSKFRNVGEAKRIRDALITKLASNRDGLRVARNLSGGPDKLQLVAKAEAAHERDCDAFADAHAFVRGNSG